MGAKTLCYVRVLVTKSEWREVSALTLNDAMYEATLEPGVVAAVEASYEKPAELEQAAV